MTPAAELRWPDPALWPFRPRHLDVDGGRMHYVDEGTGPVILLVHGTPAWSFLYRAFIADLSRDHRVVAMDHLGFGLSEGAPEWGYLPRDHAGNVRRLADALGLDDLTLVVHDFGGPIGLPLALDDPKRIRALVLFNTWMWRAFEPGKEPAALRLLGSRFGRWLYQSMNLSARVLLPLAWAHKDRLTPDIRAHYLGPFPTHASRRAPWVLARELLGSGDWYDALWQRRAALNGIPSLLLWGMKDKAFGPEILDRWRDTLTDPMVERFPEAGHFVQEEATDEAIRAMRRFLAEVAARRGE